MSEMARCPFARWRPVKFTDRLDRMSGPPRAVFLHTNGGGADLTSWFNGLWDAHHERLGCTFQVYSDGSVDQLCETDRVIYAQYAASEWAVSIETEDGNHPEHPWTGPQIDTIVRLIQWLHETHGIPLRLMASKGARGIGYHQQFPDYNKSAHNCPGPVRVSQLVHTVIPRLTGHPAHTAGPAHRGVMAHVPAPVNPLPLPANVFSVDTQTWQRQMRRRGWSGLGEANGKYNARSRRVCVAFQQEKGLPATGIVDRRTWAAAWTAPVTRP
jgi:N-acetylmuramoyl-L-alanine amidase/Putative peptidoglycan binding domain